MNRVEQRAEEAGAELRRLAERRARTMDGPDSVALAAKRRGRLQTAAAAAMVLLVAVTVGSLLVRPGVVIDPVAREVTTWTGATVDLPDGWEVASETLMPNGPVEQFVASTAPLPVGGDTCAQVPEAAMEQLGPDDALVSVQQLHPAEPSDLVLGEIETWPAENRNQTTARECADNGDQLELYWFHTQLDGTGYWVLAVFGLSASEERKAEALSILNSFQPAVDGPDAAEGVVVPDVRALPLPEAQARLEMVGLVGAPMAGADRDDPSGPDAIVVSQKPGAGETVEHGATIGFRTAIVTEPLCQVMTRLPPRQGDAADLAATEGYRTMLEDALPSATAPLDDAIRELIEVQEGGQPVTGADQGVARDIITTHHDACHLLADARPASVAEDLVWAPLPDSPLDGRADHVAVWTGETMIVWGGGTVQEMGTHPDLQATGTGHDPDTGESIAIGERRFDTGATYDPSDGSWTPIADSPIAGSYDDTGVWTGDELLVLNARGEAAAYQPRSDSWRVLPPLPLSIAGDQHTAVWTGEEMIVWRYRCDDDGCDTAGATYAPDTDTWRTIAASPLPPRRWHTAVWTGTEMIVWGGDDWLADRSTPTGAAYDPATDSWRIIPEAPIDSRQWHTATWTGSEMIVLGGMRPFAGAGYDPVADRWRTIADAPIAERWWHSATWDGAAIVVWGGFDEVKHFADGARYDPANDSWEVLPTTTLAGRCHHSAVAVRGAVLVWGGTSHCGTFGDGWHADGAALRGP